MKYEDSVQEQEKWLPAMEVKRRRDRETDAMKTEDNLAVRIRMLPPCVPAEATPCLGCGGRIGLFAYAPRACMRLSRLASVGLTTTQDKDGDDWKTVSTVPGEPPQQQEPQQQVKIFLELADSSPTTFV